ncbi:unnamed protein product [Hydatigera taeniaeformis]|uniref:Fimbrial biogenesis outer membrane usher protein n=1 Tax=Hydatigena taeniaeformis TaxID=6205 RepID=A0A0R3WSM6_HYDTA|nr:unnamed protein product [Hydatigera taeniaeformis]
MFPRLELNKDESNPLPSALSVFALQNLFPLSLWSQQDIIDISDLETLDKYGDSASQRQSDTSEQSSIDQSVLEGIRTLAFVDLSDYKNEPSLWVGTNRGSVFGFTLDVSEDSNSHSLGYNLLGKGLGSYLANS